MTIDAEIRIGSKWRNRKTQDPYLVVGFATNVTNDREGQRLVLYASSHADLPQTWARDRNEFLVKFVPADPT